MTSNSSKAIGVFDSGLGGLTSARVLERIMPNEHIVYFGDTGRVPYGTRSPETVMKYSADDLRFLLSKDVKAVLVACGTVSSIALDSLCAVSPVPIVGVVKPACAEAVKLSGTDNGGKAGRIAVLGTPATAKNGAYVREIDRLSPESQVLPIGCPMFVPLVENGYIKKDDPVTLLVAKEYIAKLKDFLPSAIILGCTHYPLIRETIETACREVLGYLPAIVDSGECAARATAHMLEASGLCADKKLTGKTEFFVSDETHNFGELASVFFGRAIENVTRIDIDKY